MKTLLILVIALSAAGYGVHGALETQKQKITAAEKTLAQSEAERENLVRKNAGLTAEVEKSKSLLAALPGSPLPAADAEELKARQATIAETKGKLEKAVAENEAALAKAQADVAAKVTQVVGAGDTALKEAQAKLAAKKEEIRKLDLLIRTMKPVIAAEEIASRGKETYKSPSPTY